MPVARDDRVLRRILPGSQAREAKFFLVLGNGRTNVHREKYRDYLADHSRKFTPESAITVPLLVRILKP
jgi:hypothetical protein